MSMLLDMREKLKTAIKTKATFEKEVLRHAIGRVDTLAAKLNQEPSDEQIASEIRKIIKGNLDVCNMYDDQRKEALNAENKYLESLLPTTLSVEQIIEALAPLADQLRAEQSGGKAIGIAMKHFKESGAKVTGKEVSAAVEQIRQAG